MTNYINGLCCGIPDMQKDPQDKFRGYKIIKYPEPIPLDDCPEPEIPSCITISIDSRKEHEALIKDDKKCQDLGLDPIYERAVYLKRWGGWLNE